MKPKIWIVSGLIVVLICALGVGAGIYGSFQSLRANDGASGIGDVGAGLEFALWSSALSLIGVIFIVVGCVKIYKNSESSK